MKKIALLFMLFTHMAFAQLNNDKTIYLCGLLPFSTPIVEAGVTESAARENVVRSCKKTHGEIFCKNEDAQCVTTVLAKDETKNIKENAILMYNDNWLSGKYIGITESVPDLSKMELFGEIKSFSIPFGWRITFYEETNYQGKSHSEWSGESRAVSYGEKIRSVKIENRL